MLLKCEDSTITHKRVYTQRERGSLAATSKIRLRDVTMKNSYWQKLKGCSRALNLLQTFANIYIKLQKMNLVL